MRNLNKILLLLASVILLFITAVTAIAVCTKNAHPGVGLRKEDPSPKSISASKTAFNNIGQIRVFSKEDENAEKSVMNKIPHAFAFKQNYRRRKCRKAEKGDGSALPPAEIILRRGSGVLCF